MENKDLQKEINQLKDVIEDLEQSNEELKTSLDDLLSKFDELEKKFQEHNHNDFDGTKRIDSGISNIAKPGDLVNFGAGMVSSTEAGVGNVVQENIMLGAGITDVFTNAPHMDYNNSNIQIAHIKNNDLGAVSFVGVGKPQIIHQNNETFSIESSGNTISSGFFTLKEGSLEGSTIKISKNYSVILEREILSNTGDTITIKGTWGMDATNVGYYVTKPVFLGNSGMRWRSLSICGIDQKGDSSQSLGITMGFNPTAQGIYFGTGVPTISANNGSIYLRSDGGSSSTLYVRASGNWYAR